MDFSQQFSFILDDIRSTDVVLYWQSSFLFLLFDVFSLFLLLSIDIWTGFDFCWFFIVFSTKKSSFFMSRLDFMCQFYLHKPRIWYILNTFHFIFYNISWFNICFRNSVWNPLRTFKITNKRWATNVWTNLISVRNALVTIIWWRYN